MTSLKIWALAIAIFAMGPICAWAQSAAPEVCPRPAAGSAVPEPEDLRSENGVLKVELTYRNFVDASGQMRYCYLSKNGSQAPTLRLKPGDELILSLNNEVTSPKAAQSQKSSVPVVSTLRSGLRTTRPLCGALPKNQVHLVLARESSQPSAAHEHPKSTDCAGSEMTPDATNLHFHGLTVPPVCHQDDVMNTMIQPGDPPFEYRFRIPAERAARLVLVSPARSWLHEGASARRSFGSNDHRGNRAGQSGCGGLSGTSADRARSGPAESECSRPRKTAHGDAACCLLDAEGDAMNTGTGTGKPAKDLSLNFVPVAYPDYHPR